MSLKNYTTVKWTKFDEVECERLIKEGATKDFGVITFPLENYFMFYCNFLNFFFVLFCYFAKENSIYRWLLLKYKNIKQECI